MLSRDAIAAKFVDFESRFGRTGTIDAYFAPGRVNLIGEHTDYNGGLALPFAVDQGTFLLIRKSELHPVRLYSDNLGLEARIKTSEQVRRNDWADYVRGIYLYASDHCGELPPFDGYYFGDLPLDSGLSSSAAIEVVTALGMETLGCRMVPEDIVKVSLRSENEFVGVSCGVMDQFAVTFARDRHAILLNCDSMDYRHVPFNIKQAKLVVVHTGVSRALTESQYNLRIKECSEALEALSRRLGPKRNLGSISIKDFGESRYALSDKLAMRAEHVIYENARVEEAARSLEVGDPETLGYLMNRSHESLRDLYEVSSFELDTLQEIALAQPGVYGCRMTGAGFGGCVIALVKSEYIDKFARRVPALYWRSTHCDAGVVITSPHQGAHRLEGA